MTKIITLIKDLADEPVPRVRLFARSEDFDKHVTRIMEYNLRRCEHRKGKEWNAIRDLIDADHIDDAWEVFCCGLDGNSDDTQVRDADDRFYSDTTEVPDFLSERELATVLAALRHAQKHPGILAGPHFDEAAPLTVSEIDELCERLNKA